MNENDKRQCRNAYCRAYEKEKRNRVSLALSKETDNDIYNAMLTERDGNKQAGLKSLLRKGILYNKEHGL